MAKLQAMDELEPSVGGRGTKLRVIDAGSQMFNVLAFDAVGDGTTDDTQAIQDAIDAAGLNGGGQVYFPAGSYRITGIVVDSDSVRLIFDCGARLLYEGTGGVAVDFNKGTGAIRRGGWENLRVARYNGSGGAVAAGSGSWTDGAVGVRVYAGVWMDGREVDAEGFEFGLQLAGGHGSACAYNNFTIKRLFDNRVNLHLFVDGDGSGYNGYCNENKIFGGNFSNSSARADRSNFWNLRIEHDPHAVLNNNVLWSPSFEAADDGANAFYIDGLYNAIMWGRYEGATHGTFGSNSDRNVIFYGRGFRADLITDNGTRNTVYSSWGTRFKAGTLDGSAAFQFSQTAGFSIPAVAIMGAGGVETVRLYGDGHIEADADSVFAGMTVGAREIRTNHDRTINWRGNSPEGNALSAEGSLAIDAVNGDAYIKKSTGLTSTGWFPFRVGGTLRSDLTTNPTLTNLSARIRNTDGGAADRTITLPAAFANAEYVIANRGSTNNIIVQSATPTTLLTLDPGEIGTFISDGTGWIAYKLAGVVT